MFEVFKDHAGEWRWRLTAANGRIIADSAEGYSKRSAVLKAIARVREVAAVATVIEKLG